MPSWPVRITPRTVPNPDAATGTDRPLHGEFYRRLQIDQQGAAASSPARCPRYASPDGHCPATLIRSTLVVGSHLGGSRPRPSVAASSEARCVYHVAVKTLVLGGGVVGVTTAYFLAKAGHEVTLVEERDGLGLEATGGNAGIIAPGHSFAWASPRAPRMLWQSLRGAETAIRVRLSSDPALYAWGLRFLRECTSTRARRNTLIKLRLCQYSQAVMNELVRAEGLEYHAISRGALYLYRDPALLEAGIKKM